MDNVIAEVAQAGVLAGPLTGGGGFNWDTLMWVLVGVASGLVILHGVYKCAKIYFANAESPIEEVSKKYGTVAMNGAMVIAAMAVVPLLVKAGSDFFKGVF